MFHTILASGGSLPPNIVAFAFLAAAMGLTPRIVLFRINKNKLQLPKERARFYTIYTLMVGFMLLAFLTSLPDLGFACIILLPLMAITGPLIAAELHVFLKTLKEGFCYHCGYNLTGNTSGDCPECGTITLTVENAHTTLGQRLKSVRWQRVLPPYLGMLLILLVLFGYHQQVDGYVCTECGESELRIRRGIYLGDIDLISWPIGNATALHRANPLTPYLDPKGTCKHKWRHFESMGYHAAKRLPYFLNRSSPAYNLDTADQPDFPAFLKTRPNLLEEIREKLRKGQRITNWLYEELDDWRNTISD